MAASLRIREQGSIVGLVGSTPIPYAYGNSAASMPQGIINFQTGTLGTSISVGAVTTFTVTAGSNIDIDLTAMVNANVNGGTATFAHVKFIDAWVSITTTTDYIKQGPQSVTNAATLCYGTTAATEENRGNSRHVSINYAGWPIDSTHKVCRFNNPGAVNLPVYLIVGGD